MRCLLLFVLAVAVHTGRCTYPTADFPSYNLVYGVPIYQPTLFRSKVASVLGDPFDACDFSVCYDTCAAQAPACQAEFDRQTAQCQDDAVACNHACDVKYQGVQPDTDVCKEPCEGAIEGCLPDPEECEYEQIGCEEDCSERQELCQVAQQECTETQNSCNYDCDNTDPMSSPENALCKEACYIALVACLEAIVVPP